MEANKLRNQIFEAILSKCSSNITESRQIYKDAQNRANEEEGAMHSRYSTFKEEGQYLAEGLKNKYNKATENLEISKEAILYFKAFKDNGRGRVGSIIEIGDKNGIIEKYFLFPTLGGEKINGLKIVTPASPLGKKLLNREEGDEFTLNISGVKRECEVIKIE
ncbi:MAG: GreA/GreB family elongation factor [Patescibacteria group bacterium]|jgi:transcription elongation GreA/GreB family factor|nr:GreA/GreB family elongation factor [Patescibacteria group bacterium]